MDLAHRVVGEGPPVLLVHGGGEDLDMHGPLIEAIAAHGFRVIGYNRRGTGGSTRENWPEGGVPQHADDAATLLRALDAVPATVVGFSSGGVVALALAEHQPDVVDQVIAWEPAAIAVLPYADEVYATVDGPSLAHLEEHPADWVGGYHVLLDVLSEGRADHDAPIVQQSERNAEAMLRDDGSVVVRYRPQPDRLPAERITLVVTEGVSPLHRDIADLLGAELGRPPEVLTGTSDHEDYLLQPGVAADRLAALVRRSAPVSRS